MTVEPSIYFSDIEGGFSGQGNIDADPMFTGVDDFHLTAGSPCINSGTNEDLPPDDLDGNPPSLCRHCGHGAAL